MSDEADVRVDYYLKREETGGTVAVGGPIAGMRFGPSTRKMKVGDYEYLLRAEDLPDPYEEPVSSPVKPIVITPEEQAAYDAETARLEALRAPRALPEPQFTQIIVEGSEAVTEAPEALSVDSEATTEAVQGSDESGQTSEGDSADDNADDEAEGGDDSTEPAADEAVSDVAAEAVETLAKPVKAAKKRQG